MTIDTTYQYRVGQETIPQYNERISAYNASKTPATPPIPTTSTTHSTIDNIFGSITPQDQTFNSIGDTFKNQATQTVDEQAIRNNVLKRMQTEIDATNQIYQEKLRQAKIAGESRLGSNAAISGRRGLLGSDFGQASTDRVTNDNNQVYAGIRSEQAAAISALMGKGDQNAQQEITAANAARQQGAENYIAFLSESEKRRTSRAGTAAQAALAQGVDLTQLDHLTLQKLADSYQISPDALVAGYVTAKNAADKIALDQQKGQQDITESQAQTAKYNADAAAAAEKAKNDKRYITLSDGTSLYDTQTGQLIAENAKNYAPTGGGSDIAGTPTSYKEWVLAGGEQGTGKTYSQYITDSNVKAPTVAQQTVSTYAARLEQSNPTIDSLEEKISSMNPVVFETQRKLPSYLQGANYQSFDQAARNFINSVLRRESGAVISPSEFDNAYKQYLPRAGDTQTTLAQKKQNRDIVYSSFKNAAGSAYQPIDQLIGNTKTPSGDSEYDAYLKAIGQ